MDSSYIPESDESVITEVLKSNSVYQTLITQKNEIEEKTKTDSIFVMRSEPQVLRLKRS